MQPFKLSPSDFAFLWEQCKRCFYLKVVHGIRQPSMPMAGIFKKIEGLQMELYDGKSTQDILPDVPAGIIRCGEKTVESELIAPAGSDEGCFIYGKIDSLIEFDDGSWGILDFKTTTIGPNKAELYGRQLHAYAYSFENPAAKPRILKSAAPRLEPITKLGLLCFEPSELSVDDPGLQTYQGEVKWIEIPRDKDKFLTFVGEMLEFLKKPVPDPTPDCDWCTYAARMASEKFGGANPPATASPTCPQCKSPMAERSGKFGRFWGCTRYPECKGTRHIG